VGPGRLQLNKKRRKHGQTCLNRTVEDLVEQSACKKVSGLFLVNNRYQGGLLKVPEHEAFKWREHEAIVPRVLAVMLDQKLEKLESYMMFEVCIGHNGGLAPQNGTSVSNGPSPPIGKRLGTAGLCSKALKGNRLIWRMQSMQIKESLWFAARGTIILQVTPLSFSHEMRMSRPQL